MHSRSASPLQMMKKLNTDRSENLPLSSRNSESNIFDISIVKNTSQIISKNDKKPENSKPQSRKASLSNYYFRNCKKNGKNVDTESFSRYLKNKHQPSQNTQQNQNRKRCITTINLATNKISLLTQNSHKKQQVTDLQFVPRVQQKIEAYCKIHPGKVAYFQAQNSTDCYCHQCSIDFVKGNRRLIQLGPEIQQVKKVIDRKIQETEKYGEELCQMIKLKINQNVKDLQRQYNQLKMRISSEILNFQKDQNNIEFSLKEVDWSFIEQLSMKMKELSFLDPIERKYRIKHRLKTEEQIQNITIHEFNEEFEMSPIPLISSTEKQRIEKVWNFDPKPKKNLMKEIENALNYQSRQTKQLKVKSISLKHDKTLPFAENHNQENINPNIMGQSHLTKVSSKQMRRLAFGNFL